MDKQMDIKNFQSKFQLVANSISHLEIKNNFINLDESQDLVKQFSLCPIKEHIETHENYKSAGLKLKVYVTIQEKNSEKPKTFSADFTVDGVFVADAATSDTEFEEKLLINGSAALFSIARGFLTNVSAQVLVDGKVVLPLVNFMEFARGNKKETEQ